MTDRYQLIKDTAERLNRNRAASTARESMSRMELIKRLNAAYYGGEQELAHDIAVDTVCYLDDPPELAIALSDEIPGGRCRSVHEYCD